MARTHNYAPYHMLVALKEVGITEVVGTKHNPRIVEYSKSTGFEFSDDETPWCSVFANWVCFMAGMERSYSAAARSWLKVGDEVAEPILGDVVVFERGGVDAWTGHVAFFVSYSQSGDYVYVLGGNQNNKVEISMYKASRVLGFRRLNFGRVV